MRCNLIVVAVTTACLGALPAPAQEADPPARVGRVAALSGTVSFHVAGGDHWERASLNLPLTDGGAVWTQLGASAALGVSGNRIALDAATELDLDHLDDRVLAATQPQGETYWHLATLQAGDTDTLQTPRGLVTFAGPGRYAVVSGDTAHPTQITVLEGAAKVTGLPAEVDIGPSQTLTITGDGTTVPLTPTLGVAIRDPFMQRMLAAERAPTRRAPLPPAVARMTGADALADTGTWGEDAEYGPVWYPPAGPGFVPYREGHWAFVAPWGWTWVDDAPWGFAPSHYGRWAEIGGRWAWIPGRTVVEHPVYAPALVGFIAGAAAGSWVGWAPLGPHEAYRPPYHVGPHLLEGMNRPTAATGPVTIINRQSVTVVPAQAMTSSVNVGHVFRTVPTLPAASSVQFRPAVEPTRATMGATAAMVHERNPHAGAVPERAPAPGPEAAPPGHPGVAALVGGVAAGGAVGAAAALLRPAEPHHGAPPLREHVAPRPGFVGVPVVPVPRAPVAPVPPGPAAGSVTRPAPDRLPVVLPREGLPRPFPAERSEPHPGSRPEPRPAARPEPNRAAPPRIERAPTSVPRPEPVRSPAAAAVRPSPPPHQPPPHDRREERNRR